MRIFKLSMLVVLTASLVLGGAGCKRKATNITPIPGSNPPGLTGNNTGNQQPPVGPESGFKLPSDTTAKTLPAGEDLKPGPDGNTPLGTGDLTNMERVPDFFKANTVYFDFDRSAVRASERVRVEEVAAYLKGQPTHVVQIEGHCDERGTEEYNRALGERRALAVREYLINAGVSPERVHTISFGEDRPAEIGSNESAWAKNRRGEFILYKPRP